MAIVKLPKFRNSKQDEQPQRAIQRAIRQPFAENRISSDTSIKNSRPTAPANDGRRPATLTTKLVTGR
ncbi:hypothetical protein [Lignipirellula cremea]|uniref:hypothetical protein n=1 Tax=Lignipirellula cremea TaxID=2528010 RepID=UPI0011A48553|nr:hypothetical protein [Lignipirellula cremea]